MLATVCCSRAVRSLSATIAGTKESRISPRSTLRPATGRRCRWTSSSSWTVARAAGLQYPSVVDHKANLLPRRVEDADPRSVGAYAAVDVRRRGRAPAKAPSDPHEANVDPGGGGNHPPRVPPSHRPRVTSVCRCRDDDANRWPRGSGGTQATVCCKRCVRRVRGADASRSTAGGRVSPRAAFGATIR